MKKINWKIINIAFWFEVILCYVLPFNTTDTFQYQVGFPMPFIFIYNTELGVNPLMSMHLNPLGLFANGMVLYLVITVFVKIYKRIRLNQR